ncbi:MAG: hypothetical protein U9Q97_01450 [Acidobacteriota bacterium]|nr:hypothetical protein [Acidobacteriota bacterium]
MINPTSAGEPGWHDVPQHLKRQDGAERRGDFLYATGKAQTLNVRADKTHEVARKKSLLRALQVIYMASSCKGLIAGRNLKEQQEFIRLFAHLAPAIRLNQVTIIRQWEESPIHFTTVAVPISELPDRPCKFPDLLAVISRYIEIEQVSLEGLAFCLGHSPRYSRLNQAVRERIGHLFQKRGQKTLALCFLPSQNFNLGNTPLKMLAFQNRFDRAIKYTLKAEGLTAQGQWDNTLDLVSQALNLVPTYAQAYLLLADYFIHELKMPTFVLSAAENALQDGTCLKKGLSRMVSCLEDLESPEAEVFHFLLSQCEKEKQRAYPAIWQSELDRLADTAIPSLIIQSAGYVIQGKSELPGKEFGKAVAIYNQAKSNDDVRRVLALLLQACERQPLSAETYNLIGACYRHLEKPAVALPFLWQALRLEPEYDYALTNLGLCCQSLGLMKSAHFYFEQKPVKNSPSRWVQESYAKFHTAYK